jgi:hypothetical protein
MNDYNFKVIIFSDTTIIIDKAPKECVKSYAQTEIKTDELIGNESSNSYSIDISEPKSSVIGISALFDYEKFFKNC